MLVIILLFCCCRFIPEYRLTPVCARAMTHVATPMYKLFINAGFWLIFLILIYCYGAIFITAKRHINQIHDQITVTNTNDTEDKLNIQKKERRRKKMKADLKLAKMSATVFALFYLSYMPLSILMILPWLTSISGTSSTIHVLRNLSSRMVYFTAITNPMTYAWRNRSFRNAFISLLSGRSINSIDNDSNIANQSGS